MFLYSIQNVHSILPYFFGSPNPIIVNVSRENMHVSVYNFNLIILFVHG